MLRLATLDESDEIDALMKASTRDLFPTFYDDAQTEASLPNGMTIGCARMQKPIPR